MNVVEFFGNTVDKASQSHPKVANGILGFGWNVQTFRYKHFGDKRLTDADKYLAYFMMNKMREPLLHPERSVMVSVMTPCELMQEVGLTPYNVEAFSCYLTGSRAEKPFIQEAEATGLADTFCSYHKSFIGAAEKGVLPRPKCIVYTNVACDANMLTFKRLARFYGVPAFYIDVPMDQTEEAVKYVERQLRDLKVFLEKETGKEINEEALKVRLRRSRRTIDTYEKFQSLRGDKHIPADLVSPLYCGMTNNVFLGTKEDEKYVDMLMDEVIKAEPKKGKHIYWMHTIPFWSEKVKKEFMFNDGAQITGDEMGSLADVDFDPEKPYEAMARRLVFNPMNGSIDRRIELGIKEAKRVKADGVVWFNHWGCKHTMGGSQLAKKRFEEEGFPTLILDGDGCNTAHGGEEQTATRIEAFLEMLNQ